MEALQIYEDIRSEQYVKPNFITVNAIISALEKANQREIAESIYRDAVRDKIITPWKQRYDIDGKRMMLVSVKQSFLFFYIIYQTCLNSEVVLCR